MIALLLFIVLLALIACLSGAIAIKVLNDPREKPNELQEGHKLQIDNKHENEYKSFHDEDGKTPLEKVFEDDKV